MCCVALADFTSLNDMDPNSFTTLYHRGLCYSMLVPKQTLSNTHSWWMYIYIYLTPCASFLMKDDLLIFCVVVNLFQYQEAVDDFSKAIEIDPDEPEPRKLRGMIYHEMKDYKRSLSDLEFVLKTQPENDELKEFLVKLRSKL